MKRLYVLNWLALFLLFMGSVFIFSFFKESHHDFKEKSSDIKVRKQLPHRIISASPTSDSILVGLISSSRVLAFTSFSQQEGLRKERFQEKENIVSLKNIEVILKLKPDLVFVNNFASVDEVSSLRKLGIHVVELGQLNGFDDLWNVIHLVAKEIQVEREAELWIKSLKSRLEQIEKNLHHKEKRKALYLNAFGKTIFIAGKNTTYDAILKASGFENLAPLQGHGQISAERIYQLNPELLILEKGSDLCSRFDLKKLPACQKKKIIEVPRALLSSSGPEMIEAVEWIVHF